MQFDDDIESHTISIFYERDVNCGFCFEYVLHRCCTTFKLYVYECILPCVRLVFIHYKEPKINRICQLYYTVY